MKSLYFSSRQYQAFLILSLVLSTFLITFCKKKKTQQEQEQNCKSIQAEMNFGLRSDKYGDETISYILVLYPNTFKGLDDQQTKEKIEQIFNSACVGKETIDGLFLLGDNFLSAENSNYLIESLPNLKLFKASVNEFEKNRTVLKEKDHLSILSISDNFKNQQPSMTFEHITQFHGNITLSSYWSEKKDPSDYSLLFKKGLIFPKLKAWKFIVDSEHETKGEKMDYMHEALPNLQQIEIYSPPHHEILGNHQAAWLTFPNLKWLSFSCQAYESITLDFSEVVKVPALKKLFLHSRLDLRFNPKRDLNLVFEKIDLFEVELCDPSYRASCHYTATSFEKLDQATFNQVFPRVNKYKIYSESSVLSNTKKYFKLMINTNQTKELEINFPNPTKSQISDIKITNNPERGDFNLRTLDTDPDYFYTHNQIEQISSYNFVFQKTDGTIVTQTAAMTAMAQKFCSFATNTGKKISFYNLTDQTKIDQTCGVIKK